MCPEGSRCNVAACQEMMRGSKVTDMQNDRNEFEEQILLDLSTGKRSLESATIALRYQDSGDTLRRLAQADLVMPEHQEQKAMTNGQPDQFRQ